MIFLALIVPDLDWLFALLALFTFDTIFLLMGGSESEDSSDSSQDASTSLLKHAS